VARIYISVIKIKTACQKSKSQSNAKAMNNEFKFTCDYPTTNELRPHANNRSGLRQKRREQPRKDKQFAAMVKKMGY
jgi:hypothetical protein